MAQGVAPRHLSYRRRNASSGERRPHGLGHGVVHYHFIGALRRAEHVVDPPALPSNATDRADGAHACDLVVSYGEHRVGGASGWLGEEGADDERAAVAAPSLRLCERVGLVVPGIPERGTRGTDGVWPTCIACGGSANTDTDTHAVASAAVGADAFRFADG